MKLLSDRISMEVVIGSKGQTKLAHYRKNNDREAYRKWRQRSKESRLYLATMFVLAEGRCPKCGIDMYIDFKNESRDDKASLDHIIPLSKTMEHTKLGFQIMCTRCNRLKANH